MTKKEKWVLLDEEGNVIRIFNYQAAGTIQIKEPEVEVDIANFEPAPF